MSLWKDIGLVCLLLGIFVFVILLQKLEVAVKENNVGAKVGEKTGNWFKRRRQKWSSITKLWFVIAISCGLLSLMNPVSTIVVMTYFLLGASTAMWLSHIVKDEKVK